MSGIAKSTSTAQGAEWRAMQYLLLVANVLLRILSLSLRSLKQKALEARHFSSILPLFATGAADCLPFA